MLSLKSGFEIAKIKDKKDKVIDTIYIKDIDEDMHEEKHMTEFVVKKSEHIQLSYPSKHFSMGVFGSSGVGKSFFVGQFLLEFKKKYKNTRPIYIFSPVKDDPAFTKAGAIYIKIDDSILTDPLQTHEFSNGLVVFDDLESVSKQYYPTILNFRNKCLEVGRHDGIQTISISHTIQGHNSTKTVLNESDYVCVFPRSNFSAIQKLCTNHYGFGKEDIQYIKNLGKTSRWVVIKRSYPSTIISQFEVKIV